jgi:hypothetical protein
VGDVGQLKERAKTVWALGDYPAVARRFEAVADEVVAAWQEANFGALVAARAALGDGYAELRERMVGLMREWNRADDGSVRRPAAYLRAVGRRG